VKENKRLILEPFLLFAAFYLPGLFSGPQEDMFFHTLSFHFLYALGTLPEAGLIIYLIYTRYPEGMEDMGIRKWDARDRKGIIPHTAILLGAVILVQIILQGASLFLPFPPDTPFSKIPPRMIPFLGTTSLLTGLREELFFRAYLLTIWRPPFLTPQRALLASSLIFASGHLYLGWPGLVNSFVLGLVFGIIFLRSRSLWQTALIHALYDFIILVALTFIPDGL